MPFWKNSKTATADYFCEIVNPDGSIAGFSGNGTRCAVAYLYYKNFWSDENLKLETKSGVKNYKFLKREENTFWFLAELGKPHFELPETPQNLASKTENEREFGLLIPSEEISCQIYVRQCRKSGSGRFCRDFEQFDWRRVGKIMETSTEMFPERTNVVFVKITGRKKYRNKNLGTRRGRNFFVGNLFDCGGGRFGFYRQNDRKVSVHAEGGTTEAVWREEDDEMMITGRADLLFCGEWFV